MQTNKTIKQHSIYSLLIVLSFFATASLSAAEEEEIKQLTADFATASLSAAAEKKVKKENKQRAAAGQKKDLIKGDVQLRRLLGLLNNSNALETHAQDSFDFELLEQAALLYNGTIYIRDQCSPSSKEEDAAADRLHAKSEEIADFMAKRMDANKNPEETNRVLDLLDPSAKFSFKIKHPKFFEIQK